MTSELQAMFAHAEAQHEAAAAGESLDDVSRARVRKGIARGETWRGVRMLGMAAAAAAVLGVGAWFALGSLRGQDPAVPLPSPTPSVSQAAASPSPSASPVETLSEAETPDPVLAAFVASLDPDLYPDAQPVTQAVWDQVSEGWALATYQPSTFNESEPGALGPQILLLTSPEGELFVAAELPYEQLVRVTKWDWASGVADAYMRASDMATSSWMPAVLDVKTGGVEPVTGLGEPEGYTLANLAQFTGTFMDGTGAWNCVRIDDAAEGGFVVCMDVPPSFDCSDPSMTQADRDIYCNPEVSYQDPTVGERNPFVGRVDSSESVGVTPLYGLNPGDPYPAVAGFRTGEVTTTIATVGWTDLPWIDQAGDVLVRVTESGIEVTGENPVGEPSMRTVFPSVGGSWVARTFGYNEVAPYDLVFVSDAGQITSVVPRPVETFDGDPVTESLISVTVAR